MTNQKTKLAYQAGRDAIVKSLGQGSNEDYADIIMLMAHQLLTQGETLDRHQSKHNGEVFCLQLQELIEKSQMNVVNNSKCGVLM